jgi:hypothetical protein
MALISSTNHAYTIKQYDNALITLRIPNVCQPKGMGVYSLSYWFS